MPQSFYNETVELCAYGSVGRDAEEGDKDNFTGQVTTS